MISFSLLDVHDGYVGLGEHSNVGFGDLRLTHAEQEINHLRAQAKAVIVQAE